ncbi:MAG: helix-hairpin-helix domain-containing protein, partial [Bacteroidota bacterium]
MLRYFIWFGLMILLSIGLQGQADSTRTAELDALIEDVISGVEIDEQVDFTEWSDELQDLLRKPLDLNRATREELSLLPGMDALRVNQLQAHIERFGALTSVFELQAVEGFTADLIRQIKPFVKAGAARETDIRRENQHPSGPGFREIVESLSFEWLQRMVWIAEEQRGYTPPDTSFRDIVDDQGNLLRQDTSLSTRYAGNPFRHYSRLRVRAGKHVSLALTAEKDPGERFAWNPRQGLYGYDFLSGHISLRDFGRLKRLVIGDYTIETGQGLILSRGLGFGKSAEAISTLKAPGRGIMPYASVNENQLMRGIAATYAVGPLYFTGFFSRINLDASVQAEDTLSQEVLEAGGLQLSGLHRTPSEIANRRSLQETVVGGRVEFRKGTLKIGTTHYYQQFAAPLDRPVNGYNQFDFRGDRNFLNGVDVDWAYRNFNLFGEAARSRSGGTAVLAGIMASLSSNFDVSLLARRFDRDFHSQKAYVFAERPTAVRNEQGLYLGLRVIPRRKWIWQSYLDRFRFPWNTFRASAPYTGWEVLSQLSYRPRRGT